MGMRVSARPAPLPPLPSGEALRVPGWKMPGRGTAEFRVRGRKAGVGSAAVPRWDPTELRAAPRRRPRTDAGTEAGGGAAVRGWGHRGLSPVPVRSVPPLGGLQRPSPPSPFLGTPRAPAGPQFIQGTLGGSGL